MYYKQLQSFLMIAFQNSSILQRYVTVAVDGTGFPLLLQICKFANLKLLLVTASSRQREGRVRRGSVRRCWRGALRGQFPVCLMQSALGNQLSTGIVCPATIATAAGLGGASSATATATTATAATTTTATAAAAGWGDEA